MDENTASEEHGDLTPIFGAYRRGYDPEKVDRYVEEQRRKLEETTNRATESERKLAAAVGQLRELHRRVAVLESEGRSEKSDTLDTLGERVQRILQEAWDGAFALRQGAEQDAAEARTKAAQEAEELVASARRKAEAVEEEIDKRRRAYLERIEAERAKAANQMTYLYDQRKLALQELMRVKQLIEATVAEIARPVSESPAKEPARSPEAEPEPPRNLERPVPRIRDEELPQTMAVHRLVAPGSEADSTSELVRRHREVMEDDEHEPAPVGAASPRSAPRMAQVFDFEREQPS